MFRKLRCVLGTLIILIFSKAAVGAVYTLTDTNTSLRVTTDSSAGIDLWTLKGIDQVFSNTYLWRVGDSGTADFIQNLDLLSANQINDQNLILTYGNADAGFEMDVMYMLSGGTTLFGLAEMVNVRNTGNEALDFRLFQYNDFDLAADAIDDVATRLNSSVIQQGDSVISLHAVVNGTTPIPAYSQLGTPFLASLTGTAGYNLDTVAGAGIGEFDSGNMAYAFQWNDILLPGQNFVIGTTKIASAPEPASWAAIGVGVAALLRRRKKK